jgi:two-component system nitrate/nitrite response regulator NarL
LSTRILLIDDHPLFRRGVAQLLGAEPDLLVVGEAGDGETGIDLAATLQPDVILLDLNMKGNGWPRDAAQAQGRRRAVTLHHAHRSPETSSMC